MSIQQNMYDLEKYQLSKLLGVKTKNTKAKKARKKKNVVQWQQAELDYMNQFGGRLTSAPVMQNKDIDLITTPPGMTTGIHTVSIKNQVDSSRNYGGITLELHMLNTRNGYKADGNFLYCKAHEYGWKVTYNNEVVWLRMKVTDLKNWVADNYDRFEVKQLLSSTSEENDSQGRVYDGTECLVIPLDILINEFKPEVIQAS